jgi:hypothetical protein
MPLDIHKLMAPVGRHFRGNRMRLFQRLVGERAQGPILDVGGNSFNWRLLPPGPPIVLINLAPEHFGDTSDQERRFLRVVADGRDLPFRNASFDVVFCNSVIEHLNTGDTQRRMAAEIARVGKSYFVQTPDRRFPVEPHFITPFFHFLPRPMRRSLARNFTVWGWITRAPQSVAVDLVNEIKLLGPSQMRTLFPDGTIITERFFGLPKSLIAVRNKEAR